MKGSVVVKWIYKNAEMYAGFHYKGKKQWKDSEMQYIGATTVCPHRLNYSFPGSCRMMFEFVHSSRANLGKLRKHRGQQDAMATE